MPIDADDFFGVYNEAKKTCAPVDLAIFRVAWTLCLIEPEAIKLGPRDSQPWAAERWREYVWKARMIVLSLLPPSETMLISAPVPPEEARQIWQAMIRPLLGVIHDIEKTPDDSFILRPVQYWEPDDAD